ncbi:L,D-transpeptidase family protein [Paracoccus saliphilus]|uniref:L,D-transpeptidase catalytic domain n=1 Tax=Paracoccus saliphilus TaxID=405559 RepID=A0AA46A448_9RHOB|nr:L,D-transpeptidase family protein [Paracoccus saliphilus]WCR03545.1 L,D-transpeptidase family protein [Paracoccus saliphilus]SIS55485.1 L,D-transpeptidase catalytic domain [Paracoccus saliphilus]
MQQSSLQACLLIMALFPGVSMANIDRSTTEITQLLLDKSERTLHLLNGRKSVSSYKVDLGPSPEGHKRFQGDGRTPEGLYYISHKNPNSRFHLSLGISYPNARDSAHARAQGLSPGGDIFIHGRGTATRNPPEDWTLGCVAVSDDEMTEIYDLVKPGTPIFIKP